MALNIKDFKKECKKKLQDIELMSLAFDYSIKFLADMLEDLDKTIELNLKTLEGLQQTHLKGVDDTYINWYKETLTDKNNLQDYIYKNIDELQKAKEDTLEVMGTTDYGKAVRDLLNENSPKLKYDTFALLDGMSVTNYIYLTCVLLLSECDTNDKLIINCTYSIATRYSTYYQELQNSKEFSEKDQDYKDLCFYLIDINTKVKDKVKELELQERHINEQMQLPLFEYSEKLTLTDTPLINSLALTPNSESLTIRQDSEVFRELADLKSKYDFKINADEIAKSEEQLQQLTELDRFVLDTIVTDIFFKGNKREFTDRQLVVLYTKEHSASKISENIQDEINKSILKLQNTRVNLGLESIQKLKSNKVKVNSDNPLIWLKKIQIDKETSTTHYRIIDTPFYYSYLKLTNAPLITYNRDLLYKEIKGVNKSLDSQALRHFLIRRVTQAVEFNTELYLNLNDIYNETNTTAKYYPKNANLRKARQRARENTELILDELKKEYSFTYSQDNRTQTIKGYILKPKKKIL